MKNITKEDWINLTPASEEFSEYTILLDEMAGELKKVILQSEREGKPSPFNFDLIHRYEKLKFRQDR